MKTPIVTVLVENRAIRGKVQPVSLKIKETHHKKPLILKKTFGIL